ncbi:hypothetical protein [Chryseobacterium sp. HR92]|uniref:hypothetical protein n=1 Tax=Chryseobacterium sp. HR92 TaxID=3094839 RepID=UPI0038909633|nr:hypothetical protein SFA27_15820 [Chryseobacterium sp. HR92]
MADIRRWGLLDNYNENYFPISPRWRERLARVHGRINKNHYNSSGFYFLSSKANIKTIWEIPG